MQIKPLSMHSNVFAYLRHKFPQMVDSFADIPVVDLTESEWLEDGTLTGYGYLVKQDAIDNVEQQLPNYSTEQMDKYRSIYSEVNRDMYIYDIYKRLKTVPFFLIREGNEASIVHELAHVVWDQFSEEERSAVKLPEVSTPDQDQYLESPHERFSHMSEMEYFKSQGMIFEDYFRTYNPREYQLLQDPMSDPKERQLALMDYNDYQSIWNQTKVSNFSANNWFTKIAQGGLMLQESTHSSTGRPIYYLTGQTYPLRSKLGRGGLGFTWYGARKMWWMYKERLDERIGQSLQSLGIDTSVLGGSEAPGAPPVTPGISEPPMAPQAAPVASGLTNQSWDVEEAKKSKWYGFPVNTNIYSTTVPVEVEGQQVELLVRLDRVFKKGRRGIPSYRYEISMNGESVGRLAKAAPGKWGFYNEDEIAQSLPEMVQGQLGKREKSKTYNNIKYKLQVAGRDPGLIDALKQQYDEYDGNGESSFEVNVPITEPGYEGEYPVTITTISGNSWYGKTALDHPQAPRPKTIFYLGEIPPEVHNMDQFNVWLQQAIQENMPRAQRDYLEYLQSFPFTQADQDEATGQFEEILPIIESKSMDVNFFRQKMMSMGYIRPHRRQKNTGPGMQPQESIKVILDSRKIVDDAYEMGQLSRTPNFFYTALAYLMHRQKAGNIGFGAAYGQLGQTMREFHDTLLRHGATIDFGELNSYIENLSGLLLRNLLGTQSRGSAWDNYEQFYGGGTEEQLTPEQGGIAGLEPFIQFTTLHGLDPEVVRANPIKGYRELAIRFHPDRNPNNPEAEDLFKQLGAIWDMVPAVARKRAESWLYRACIA